MLPNTKTFGTISCSQHERVHRKNLTGLQRVLTLTQQNICGMNWSADLFRKHGGSILQAKERHINNPPKKTQDFDPGF